FIDAGRPEGNAPIEPGDFLFDVAPAPLGGIRRVEDPTAGEGIDAWVFLGTPRLHRTAHTRDGEIVEALTIKANTIVAWVDRAQALAAGGAFGLPTGGRADRPETGASSASIIPQALQGIYAEGAVELSFGKLVFRAERLYIEPHTYKALLIEPRFDGRSVGIGNVEHPLELFVRARRARIVSQGLIVFDDAEVATSRAEDSLFLQLRSLTTEELREPIDDEGRQRAEVLGFHADSSQWYSGRTLTLRGERLPLLMLPRVDFGYSETTEAITSPLKSIDMGNKSEVGRFLTVRVGTPIGPRGAPWFDLSVEGGGYTKRGFAAGVGAKWNHTQAGQPLRSIGEIETWGVDDHRTFDSDDYAAPDDFRWRVVSESRTWLGKEFQVDHEFNAFSDRGFNNEFFERDDLHHKDRESYVRGRWQPTRPGNVVTTLDGKWHQRDFVTETVQLPELGVWVLPAPLLRPTRRGGLGIDVTTETRAGYLGREFDEALGMPSYEAWRLHTDTLLNAAVDAGDVRLVGHVGVSGSVYAGRTDGGPDLERAALLAGVRANLQSWRVFQAQGGWFGLNGLRHVVDVDGELAGRFFDSDEPADVPYFDLHETERRRTAIVGRWRNRLQTRRGGRPGPRGTAESGMPISASNRTVADLELGVRWFLDDRGPFLRESPGDFEARFYGEVRPGLELAGEADVDFDDGLQTSSIGAGWRTELKDRPFSLFAGYRYVKERSTSVTAEASWRFSERYAVQALGVRDFNEGEDLLRVLFRRYSDDHIFVFGFNVRNADDFGVEISFEPAIGGRTTEGATAFKDYPNPDPWGAFRR
ncbi:MAG: hypothetical protein O2894_08265, partial [Planctomycetota bacterium]|nr:hypothetical protein [Planctomycetota bacterium]